MVELQAIIKGMEEPVVMPHRKFLRGGKLIVIQKAGLMRNLVEKKRVAFLFNDCMVFTTVQIP